MRSVFVKSIHLLVLCSCVVVFVLQTNADTRTWTDRNGRTTRAEFVRMLGNNVVLKLPSGRILTLPIDYFSADDQQHIEELLAKSNSRTPRERVWTDINGNQVRATFVESDGDQVSLRQGNDRATLMFDQLSRADRNYVLNQLGKDEENSGADENDELTESRTWTDSRGNKLVARFDSIANDKVLLTLSTATRVIPYRRLGVDDQQFLLRCLTARGRQDELPDTRVELEAYRPAFELPQAPKPPRPQYVVQNPTPPIDQVAQVTPNTPQPTPNRPLVTPTRPSAPNVHPPKHSPNSPGRGASNRDRSSRSEEQTDFGISPNTAIALMIVGGLMDLAGTWWIGAIALQKGDGVWGLLCFLCCGCAVLIYGFCNTDECGTPLVLCFAGMGIHIFAQVMVVV